MPHFCRSCITKVQTPNHDTQASKQAQNLCTHFTNPTLEVAPPYHFIHTHTHTHTLPSTSLLSILCLHTPPIPPTHTRMLLLLRTASSMFPARKTLLVAVRAAVDRGAARRLVEHAACVLGVLVDCVVSIVVEIRVLEVPVVLLGADAEFEVFFCDGVPELWVGLLVFCMKERRKRGGRISGEREE